MSWAPPVGAFVEPQLFRHILGHVPSPVTVVTAATAAGPAGLVVGSFVSVSLEPPLVGIFIDEKSVSWPPMSEAGSFTVNILAHDQQELCARFAKSGGSGDTAGKFAGLTWWESPHGNPVLPGTTAWLDCLVRQVQRLGDHFFAVAEVVGLGVDAARPPLVFHRGALHTVAPSGEGTAGRG
ncbi:flavin reductase family protein [Streptomyces sp. NPDC005878]|uniref:flavin reductase family protein n=2 Tax=unclassified Streptomyces TaxID=2593676 RepID=UPI0033DF45B3